MGLIKVTGGVYSKTKHTMLDPLEYPYTILKYLQLLPFHLLFTYPEVLADQPYNALRLIKYVFEVFESCVKENTVHCVLYLCYN